MTRNFIHRRHKYIRSIYKYKLTECYIGDVTEVVYTFTDSSRLCIQYWLDDDGMWGRREILFEPDKTYLFMQEGEFDDAYSLKELKECLAYKYSLILRGT